MMDRRVDLTNPDPAGFESDAVGRVADPSDGAHNVG